MTEHPLIHGTFSLQREIAARPDLVFRAWADPEAKGHWFIGPEDWTLIERHLELKPGGEERLHGRFGSGTESLYSARYHVIVPDVRLVYAYDMYINGMHLSVSLASVEFEKSGEGTRMTYTEQAVYLGGEDDTDSRRNGTSAIFDRLVSHVDAVAAEGV